MQKQRQDVDVKRLAYGWRAALIGVMEEHDVAVMPNITAIHASQVLVFRLILAKTAHLKKIKRLEEEVGMRLNTETPRIERNRGYVDVHVPLPKELHRRLPLHALPKPSGTKIPLGQTVTGQPVVVDFTGNAACHTLIAGITGSGKTVTQQLVSYLLAASNEPDKVRLLLIDGKGGVMWKGFDRLRHLTHPVIGEAHEALGALAWVVAELDKRRSSGQNSPRLFVIIDELRDIVELGGDAVGGAISRIVSLGRELGIHLIAATQHPLVDAVGGSVASANFPLRLTGVVRDSNNAYRATGIKDSGAENLRGNGDFLLVAATTVARFQVAWVGNREIGKLYQYRLPESIEPPRLPVEELDIDRVLSVVDDSDDCDLHFGPDEADAVTWAMFEGAGVRKICQRFAPMGTDRGRRIRDVAKVLRAAAAKQGLLKGALT